MSACTFIRIEAYAREAPHKRNSRKRKQSIDGVFGEMMRNPDCCPHVPDPKEPHVLYGDPRAVLNQVKELAAGAVEATGNRLRSTGLCLVAGVISYPVARAHVEKDLEERARCDRWWEKSRAWLEKKYGGDLKLIVAHWDEAFVNWHFVLVPKLGPDRRLRIGDVHPGHHAEQACNDAGGSGRMQKQAHQEAMRKLVSEFYEGVAIEFGFARYGPMRQRLDRDGWKAQTKQLHALAEAQERLRRGEQQLKVASEKKLAEAIAEAEDRAAKMVADRQAAADHKFDNLKRHATAKLQQMQAENRQLKLEAEQWRKIASGQEETIRKLEEIVSQFDTTQSFKPY